MYTKINILKSLEPEAEQFILDNDRMLYLPFFEEAERCCKEFGMILGGKCGLDLLLNKGITKDSFFWEIYAGDIYNNAKLLAIRLSKVNSPHIPARTVALRTDIKYKEFTISINARMFFKIYALGQYRGLELAKIMGPTIKPTLFTKEPVGCIPEEIQLIDIYRTLYTPAKISMWSASIEAEKTIYDAIKFLARKAVGGGSDVAPKSDNVGGISNTIIAAVLNMIADEPSQVLVGDYALAAIGIEKLPNRIQFIAEGPIEDIVSIVERTIKKTHSGYSGNVTSAKFMLNVPGDFQIIKYTLYLTGKEQIPLADVFNSAEYEMIPWWVGRSSKGNIKIGNPWVLLRFQFIDIWALRLILNIGTKNTSSVKNKINNIINRAECIRRLAYKTIEVKPENIFQLTNYAGKYINESVAKKKLIKEIGERFATFYPAVVSGGVDNNDHIGSKIDKIGININDLMEMKLVPRYTTSVVDINIDKAGKRSLLQKIIPKRPNYNNIMAVLRGYYGTAAEYSKWGINRNVDRAGRRNAKLIPFIPDEVNVHLDIGCGDGIDIVAIKRLKNVGRSICADIEDNRDTNFRDDEMITIEIGKPLPLEDKSVDLVTMFHVIHHSIDAEMRLRDIGRIMTPGGVLLLKDHDVNTRVDASNVDFEHLVYYAGTAESVNNVDVELNRLINNWPEIEPMYYYPASDVTRFLESLGFRRIFFELNTTPRGDIGPSRIYQMAFIFDK